MKIEIQDTAMSESIKNIAKAQANMQKELTDTKKDTKGYGYLYTNLDSLVKHLRPLLTKHGLSFMQMPVGSENQAGIQTIYMHTSGEWITSLVKVPIADLKGQNAYQSLGSAITYLRRYSLSAFVGIASDEDNDAQGGPEEIKKVVKVTTTQLKKLNVLQMEAKKRGLISINQSSDLDKMKLNMTLDQYTEAYRRLDEKIVQDNNLDKFDQEMEVRKTLIDEE
tara:strand:- start:241 stop:909 length:669 start_codon:yes stop_codon:yes gene_type:complete